ncbi:MAG: hypothetical protein EZS28_014688 [Streblomastix strix]|uniref:Uncharacterized protein n=1 Tax=Streblomastix strix TaxID=222440 RepID=A0A5J4W465_9EUKA|nr:MAG: hypothetical protein EZS28_014688 [Streblomastix strix]
MSDLSFGEVGQILIELLVDPTKAKQSEESDPNSSKLFQFGILKLSFTRSYDEPNEQFIINYIILVDDNKERRDAINQAAFESIEKEEKIMLRKIRFEKSIKNLGTAEGDPETRRNLFLISNTNQYTIPFTLIRNSTKSFNNNRLIQTIHSIQEIHPQINPLTTKRTLLHMLISIEDLKVHILIRHQHIALIIHTDMHLQIHIKIS